MHLKHIVIALPLLGLSATGLAAENSPIKAFYIGGGGGQSEVDDFCDGASNCDDTDTAWKIFGGYRFNPNIAIEAGYVDFGEFTASDTIFGFSVTGKAEVTGVTAHVLGILPVHERVSLMARAGTIYSDVDIKASGAGITVNEDDQSFAFAAGLGAEFNITDQFALRAEYELFKDVGDDDETGESDVTLLSASALFRF